MAKKKGKRLTKDEKALSRLEERFMTEFGEHFGDERIEDINAGEAVLGYTQVFAANKNLYRTFPSLISGLKPGKQRYLYSFWELCGSPQDLKKESLKKLKFIKVDRTASNSTGMYHPHGGAATEEMVGKTGQSWSNNILLITPQGSYGNMRNDPPAAGRYIECSLSEYTIDCFFSDFDKYCVPMRPSYTGETNEPEYLPAKYPHVLFNPQFSGIGWGAASNIPPFNIQEVLEATITLIRNPDAKIMLVPDSPTGCDIVDNGMFKEINRSGEAKLVMRASSYIDYENNIIHVTSLPLNGMSDKVIRSIINLQNEKDKFKDIVAINDYTKLGDVHIEFVLKSDAKPDKILKQLYKKNVGLKSTFPVSITVIDDFTSHTLGVKDLLKQWIDYRLDAVRSMMLNNLQIVSGKQHMNEALLKVFAKDNIDKAVRISKEAASRKDTIEKLMKAFKITSLQAAVIADMHVYNFNQDSYQRYLDDKEKLKEEMDEVMRVLSSDDELKEYIVKQLEDGIKKYGTPRKSKIIRETDKDTKDIPDTDHLVGITENGFIKKITLKDGVSIGNIGNSNGGITVFDINNRDCILVIDSLGRVNKVPISAVPNMDLDSNGVELKKFFHVGKRICAVMELPSMDLLKQENTHHDIIFITKKGIAKRVNIHEFSGIYDYKQGITLKNGDELASAMFSFDKNETGIIIATTQGNAVHLNKDDIREASLVAKGAKIIDLAEDEEVMTASMINPTKKLFFMITSGGRAKVVESKYFPIMNKNEKPLNLISLVSGEELLGVSSVGKTDLVKVYRKKGAPEDLPIKSLGISTRIQKPKKVLTAGRGDTFVAYKVFRK